MPKQVKEFKLRHGGTLVPKTVSANAAITTGYGTPVYDLGTGYYGACADAASRIDGFLVGGQGHATSFYTPGADAQGDSIQIYEATDDLLALMRVKGTAAITALGAVIDLDFADAANYYAEVDAEGGGDGLKLESYHTNVEGDQYAWVSVNQAAGPNVGS